MVSRAKNYRDVYALKAKSSNYRARSALKLLDIDDRFDILSDKKKAIDLCCAPGSWSQVLSKRFEHFTDSIIISIDIQTVREIPSVHHLQNDITKNETLDNIKKLLKNYNHKVDIVLCDGAPDLTGSKILDEISQTKLILAALRISIKFLDEGGVFVSKIFKTNHVHIIKEKLLIFFEEVYFYNSSCTRANSSEFFAVCKYFKLPTSFPIGEEIDFDNFCSKINQISNTSIL